MSALHAHNVVEADSINGDKGTWSTTDSSNQESAAHFPISRPANGNPRAPLANGTIKLNLSQQPAHNPAPNETLPNSESDSLPSLHGDSSASNPHLGPSQDEDHIPENMYRPEDQDPDPEKWIHRDKLARIENEELQAAGLRLDQESLGRTGRRGQSGDRLGYEHIRPEPTDHWGLTRNKERPRVSSPVDGGADSPDSGSWDPRNPEERVASDYIRAIRNCSSPGTRKSGSKIPVLTSSPLPIPPERLDRDKPLPRKRNFSGSLEDDEVLVAPRVRARGASVGSHNLLEETQVNNSTPNSTSNARSGNNLAGATSPTLAKAGTKPLSASTTTPQGAARKITPSGARRMSSTHKPRVTSNSNNGSPPRFTTHRSTDPDRPRTAVNRPEGEAPWIATMYKPDPRLPQDQQIIPTHAKKQQQQQQQQKQGSEIDQSTAGTYHLGDPFSAQPESGLREQLFSQPSSSPPTFGESKDDHSAWPLKPIASVQSTTPSRPGTGGSGTGGYTTMPKVISSPLNSPPIDAVASQRSSSAAQDVQRSPLPRELDKKKERCCGCCVIM